MLLSRLVNRIKTLLSRLPSLKSNPASTWPRPASVQRSLSPEDRIRRAEQAQELLSSSLLREAVYTEEMNILNQMRQCSLSDKESHTRLVMALQMSSAVTRNLWRMINDGNEAAESIRMRGTRLD